MMLGIIQIKVTEYRDMQVSDTELVGFTSKTTSKKQECGSKLCDDFDFWINRNPIPLASICPLRKRGRHHVQE